MRYYQKLLFDYIEEHEISQVTIGTRIGVSGESIRKWLNLNIEPSVDKLEQIARFFRVPLFSLLIDTTSKDPRDMLALQLATTGIKRASEMVKDKIFSQRKASSPSKRQSKKAEQQPE